MLYAAGQGRGLRLQPDRLTRVKALHERDLARGHGRAPLPDALDRKYPHATTEWRWQARLPLHGAESGPPDRRGLPLPHGGRLVAESDAIPQLAAFETTPVISSRSDYTTALGTLNFAPGETAKTFMVFVTDNAFVTGPETFYVLLSNPNGVSLGFPSAALITISRNESASTQNNPVDAVQFFVRQHYRDFLNRDPDATGLQFWTNDIEQCGADAACREVHRVNVSAAFFLSIEFQNTGYLVYRLYKASFNTGERLPLRTFLSDTQERSSTSSTATTCRPRWSRRSSP